MGETGFYTAYTRQAKEVLEELEKNGVYRVKEEYVRLKNDSISDYYIGVYEWLTTECRKCMDIPAECRFPIWLSMHDEYRLRNTEHTVSFRLRIPKSQVRVISEYAWGYRINFLYVPLSKEDEQAFNAELRRYGIGNESELITGSLGNFYPLLKRKIQQSFSRVLTLPPKGPFDELGICYEIRSEWIEAIETE